MCICIGIWNKKNFRMWMSGGWVGGGLKVVVGMIDRLFKMLQHTLSFWIFLQVVRVCQFSFEKKPLVSLLSFKSSLGSEWQSANDVKTFKRSVFRESPAAKSLKYHKDPYDTLFSRCKTGINQALSKFCGNIQNDHRNPCSSACAEG